jgi:short-subunit dehydrogenase
MLKKNTECHIVNTASVEGLWSRIRGASYQATKHAVVVISEVLKMEMAFEEKKVGVSVLCPGGVNTGIIESQRNRPSHLQNPGAPALTPQQERQRAMVRQVFSNSMDPLTVADKVFDAVATDQFYILTHPELNPRIEKRIGRILTNGTPLPEFTISNVPQPGMGMFGNTSVPPKQ